MFSSIRSKLALVVIAGVLPAVLLVSLYAASRETSRRTVAANAELAAVGEALAVTLSLPLSLGNQADVMRALRATGRMPNVTYARVTDVRGQTIAQFGVGIVRAGGEKTSRSLSQVGFLDILTLKDHLYTIPIVAGGVRVGRLDMVADISNLGREFRDAIFSAILAAIGAGILGLLISMPILALVTNPLLSLAREMKRIQRAHDYSPVEHVGSSVETKLVVDSFNAMLSEIRARDETLARHRATLEQAVEQRTAELHVARQAAESANAAKSEFLAAMSHEIRTPMHGMLVTAELLQTTPLDERQRRFAQIITRSGQSLLAIVNDILDLSKIEAGRLELERVPLQPAQVAAEVVELFQARAAEKNLLLDSRCDPDVPACIAGDPVRLTQILSNLVGNAIKFTERGQISIALSLAPAGAADAGRLRFSVSDTGIGIEPESLERIFDAFEQAASDTTRRFGGTGIGLAICRKLSIAMGGTISAESRIGRGSTFTCSIPFEVVDAPLDIASDTSKQDAMTFQGVRVLAADDNAVNRLVLEASLERWGVIVVSVENGQEAVQALEKQSFDLVLMDCSMPVMDGYAATRAIREVEKTCGRPATPIVALTAHVIGTSSEHWRDAGMSDYLTKPFTQAGLAAMLEKWCPVRGPATPVLAASPTPRVAEPTSAPERLAEPVLDIGVVEQIATMGHGASLLTRMVGLFREHGRIACERLGRALEQGASDEIAPLAHAVKSMSLSIGANRLAVLASSVEDRAQRREPITDVTTNSFLAHFEEASAALDGECARRSSPATGASHVA